MKKADRTIVKVGEYRGVEVTVEGIKQRQFAATVGAQRFFGPSWESLTKKLDEAIGFEPRDVVMEVQNGRKWEVATVRVVGKEKSHYGMRFIKADGEPIKGGSTYDVKARTLMEERRRLSDALDKVKGEYIQKIDDINEKLNPFLVRPDGE